MARGDERSGRRRTAGKIIAVLAVVAVGWIGFEWATWPEVARLATERPDTTAFMRSYLDRRAARPELPELRWSWVPLSEMSAHVQRAVVSAEDMEFFHHRGFSTSEIRAAIQAALEGDDLRGASTITQQLAKNLWLTPSRNPLRKLREAILTWQLEKELTKSRVLEIYLNVVELGPGIYGVGAASRHYFGTSAAALTERRAAMLAASLPRPSTWHPGVESTAYAGYVQDVLGRMDRAEFLWRYVSGEAPPEAIPEPTAPRLPGAMLVSDTAIGGAGSPPIADTLPTSPETGGSEFTDTMLVDTAAADTLGSRFP